MGKSIDLTGQRFGRLTAVEPEGRDKHGNVLWRCRCDCGGTSIVVTRNLLNSNSTSCGCRRRETTSSALTTHGASRTRAYVALKNAEYRCSNPENCRWSSYGGRGITVCGRWLDDPQTFIEDMGEPAPGMTLERVDVNGDYCPENCIWADRKTQQRNKRNNRLIEFRGEVRCLADWSDITGISYAVLANRCRRGWTPEEMLTTSVDGRKGRRVATQRALVVA